MDFAKIIEALKGARWYLVLATLIGSFVYIFREEVGVFLTKGTESIFEDNNIEEIIDRDVIVNELLYELMTNSASDRAYVFRFHNGQNYFDGTHKVRMSCEYEVVKRGIEPQSDNLRDIPTSLVSWFIKETIEGRMYYSNVDSIPDVKTRVLLKRQGIRSIGVAPYYDHSGRLVSLIGVDYVGKKASREDILRQQGSPRVWDSEYQKQMFINSITSIGETISYYDAAL